MLSWIELNGSRFKANVDGFRSITSPGTLLMVVIKANAYGHGLRHIAPIAAESADWLGVNSIDEALAISELGIRKTIAILGHTEIGEANAVVMNDYRQVLYRLDVAQALSRETERAGRPANVHLKVETGTNRQGVLLDDLREF